VPCASADKGKLSVWGRQQLVRHITPVHLGTRCLSANQRVQCALALISCIDPYRQPLETRRSAPRVGPVSRLTPAGEGG
jgi:hypothetical protein